MSSYCFECGGKTKVIDSRNKPDGTIRRRRECLKCKSRFSTYEKSLDAFDEFERTKRLMLNMTNTLNSFFKIETQDNDQ